MHAMLQNLLNVMHVVEKNRQITLKNINFERIFSSCFAFQTVPLQNISSYFFRFISDKFNIFQAIL